jgi:hypothetical protein
MHYILRLTEPDDHDDGTLQLFSDEQKLGGYLAQLAEMAQVSGLGPLVAGLWCWDDDDQREELEIVMAQLIPEGEWTDMLHWVCRKSDGGGLFSFTARVRGKDLT